MLIVDPRVKTQKIWTDTSGVSIIVLLLLLVAGGDGIGASVLGKGSHIQSIAIKERNGKEGHGFNNIA
jgi:hypothetical protein